MHTFSKHARGTGKRHRVQGNEAQGNGLIQGTGVFQTNYGELALGSCLGAPKHAIASKGHL